VFDTSDSRFDRFVDNQGWWATALEAQDGNDNYALGACREECVPRTRIRNFFSFDLSTLKAKAVGATLVLRRYGGLGGFTETLGLFDVRTPAQRLSNNQGVDRRIYRDLGSGSATAGTFFRPTSTSASWSASGSTALQSRPLTRLEAASSPSEASSGALASPRPTSTSSATAAPEGCSGWSCTSSHPPKQQRHRQLRHRACGWQVLHARAVIAETYRHERGHCGKIATWAKTHCDEMSLLRSESRQ
jgi:hypothetical protein